MSGAWFDDPVTGLATNNPNGPTQIGENESNNAWNANANAWTQQVSAAPAGANLTSPTDWYEWGKTQSGFFGTYTDPATGQERPTPPPPNTVGGGYSQAFNPKSGKWEITGTPNGGFFGFVENNPYAFAALAAAGVIGAGVLGGAGATLAPAAGAGDLAGSGLAVGAAGEAGIGTGLEGGLLAGAAPGLAAGAAPLVAGAAPLVAGAAPGAAGAAPLVAGAGPAAGGFLGSIGHYAPLIATGVGALGSLGGALIQSGAAKDAAATQAGAAAAANQTLQDQYTQNRSDLAPYRAVGTQALGGLTNLTAQPLTYGGYQAQAPLDPSGYAFNAQPYDFNPQQYAFNGQPYAFNPQQYAFTPPSGQDVLNQDPGYQFRVQQGQQQLDRQAAGKGQLLSGGQLKGAARFSQDLASQEYQAAYSRSLGQNQMTYERGLQSNQMGYGRALSENQLWYDRALQGNQQGYQRALAGNEQTYGRAQTANEQAQQRALLQYGTNLSTQTGLRQLQYNELAGLAGTGQTATSQLGQFGAQMAGNVANNMTSAGAAQAAGQVGSANAIAGGFQGVGNAANSYLSYSLMQQQMANQQNQQGLLLAALGGKK